MKEKIEAVIIFVDQFKFLVYDDQSTKLISDVFVTYESRFCSVDAGNLELW